MRTPAPAGGQLALSGYVSEAADGGLGDGAAGGADVAQLSEVRLEGVHGSPILGRGHDALARMVGRSTKSQNWDSSVFASESGHQT